MGVFDGIAGSVVGAAINGAINYGLQNKAQNFNAEQAELQRDWQSAEASIAYGRQRQLIAEQRTYDTPASQMQRLVEAGLNPDLIYGQLNPTAMSNSAPQATGGAFAVSPPPSYDSLVNGALVASQIKKNESESSLSNAKAAEILGNTPFAKANVALINAQTKRLSQEYNLNRLNELKSDVLVAHFSDDDSVMTIKNEDGSTWSASPKDVFEFYVEVTGDHQMFNDQKEAEVAFKLLTNKLKLSNFEVSSADLKNRDLEAFVEICSRYYNALADEQGALAAMAMDDNEFVSKFGGRESFRAISGTVGHLIDGLSSLIRPKMFPKLSKKN